MTDPEPASIESSRNWYSWYEWQASW